MYVYTNDIEYGLFVSQPQNTCFECKEKFIERSDDYYFIIEITAWANTKISSSCHALIEKAIDMTNP